MTILLWYVCIAVFRCPLTALTHETLQVDIADQQAATPQTVIAADANKDAPSKLPIASGGKMFASTRNQILDNASALHPRGVALLTPSLTDPAAVAKSQISFTKLLWRRKQRQRSEIYVSDAARRADSPSEHASLRRRRRSSIGTPLYPLGCADAPLWRNEPALVSRASLQPPLALSARGMSGSSFFQVGTETTEATRSNDTDGQQARSWNSLDSNASDKRTGIASDNSKSMTALGINISTAEELANSAVPLSLAHSASALRGSPEVLVAPIDELTVDRRHWRLTFMIIGVAAAVPCWLFVVPVMLSFLLRYSGTWADTSSNKKIRREVDQVRVSKGGELRSMFALGAVDEESNVGQPLSPGLLMRIQGRVVAAPGAALTAPFSGRSCVMYSASVTRCGRHDGIHQPPIAFHMASTDFAIQLSDMPDVVVQVHGHDVSLFDMEEGQSKCEHAFQDAPDAWRGFVLAHHLQSGADTSASFGSYLDLGSDGVELEFRECALAVGSEVTCLGEVARDRCGALGIFPWRPTPAPSAVCRLPVLFPGSTHIANSAKDGHSASQDRRPSKRKKSSLVGQVMISNSTELLGGRWVQHEELKQWLPWPSVVALRSFLKLVKQ